MFKGLAVILLLSGLSFTFYSCAMIKPAPQDLVDRGDHAGLENYYKKQAQDLREQAKNWETLADSYERHRDPHGKLEPTQHAAHCRAIGQAYRKAADEADELAREHRQQLPHGMVQ